MTIIGITGPSGAGKTTVLRLLASLGGAVFDCDEIYHELLKTDAALLSSIEAAFPGTVSGGALDRKKLGALVFSDPAALEKLNRLTHETVRREVLRRLSGSKAPFAVIDAVGLFESGLDRHCALTLAITADEALRLARLQSRDGLTREEALRRIQAQTAAFTAQADYVLENNGTETELKKSVWRIINMSKQTEALRNALLHKPKNGYDRITDAERAEMEAYCGRYIRFLDAAKTEREAVSFAIGQAQAAGFVPLEPGMKLQPGDRVYRSSRGKSLILAVVGSEPIDEGARITASHIDSPRLDVKPNPLYEDAGLALLKTHYYGGIKKYQWTTIPLSIHGVIAKKDGSTVTVSIGEKADEPCFCVTDLLIHLSKDQMQKTLAEGVTGENLNILFGSEPIADDEGADRVKLAVLSLLHERYGVTEEDFFSAELTMVPAAKARLIGLDGSMIGAYGQDDRSSAYACFEPLLQLGTPKHTAVCVLADKEEIGSVGVSGVQSDFFDAFIEDLCDSLGGTLRRCYERSLCLSADVAVGFDPSYAEVCDKRNSSFVNQGVAILKYTGSRGKSNASDAGAEVVCRVRGIFDRAGVLWQTCEIGKVDQGGGGTVARFITCRNIDTLDAGVPLLCMHAPMEIAGKLDCYMLMRGMKAIYED